MDSYKSKETLHATTGMLTQYKFKNLSDKPNQKVKGTKSSSPLEPGYTTTRKLAAESLYMGLKVIFITNNKEVPPPFGINDLIS